jgi:hypothetical protein
MEPEINQIESRLAPLQKVTPLSKYLAMVLFIIMPFFGGWIGYRYAPEKIVEVESLVNGGGVPDVVHENIYPKVISKSVVDSKTFTCDHVQLNEISLYAYEDWPVYSTSSVNVSFSYPPDQAPNFEEWKINEDGKSYLSLGYAPLFDIDKRDLPGKPVAFDFDSSWQVEIHQKSDIDVLPSQNFCSDYPWCLLEEVDYRGDVYTYVSTYEDKSIANPYLREYFIYPADDVNFEVRISSAAFTSLDAPPCFA